MDTSTDTEKGRARDRDRDRFKDTDVEIDADTKADSDRGIESVPYSHGGGWSRKINARYLHTLMVYL